LLLADVAKLDLSREGRTGMPEVILAEGKLDGHLVSIAKAFTEARGRAIVSRLAPERLGLFASLGFETKYHERGHVLVLSKAGNAVAPTGGRVLVLAAGTADIPVAEEARVMAEELGCETRFAYDVGVAGIHRLFPELDAAQWADVVIVAAGREGALATVVAGLVDRPVIGLPVSVGYGMGGRGEAALLSMLQACSPLLTVNIDAGVVAGMCAAQIANRVARARESPGESVPLQESLIASGARRE
jgi:NCAIR mutase (PurE)-related protein